MGKRSSALAAAALGALAAPGSAAAHTAGIEYDFPLPVWVYGLAGAAAVLASAPAAAIALRPRTDRVSRNLYPSVARLHLGAIGLALATLLLLVTLAGGFFGDPISFTANPAPLIIWVDFWVGLGVVSGLVINAWDFVSPLSALGRGLDRLLARRGVGTRSYPEQLGVWPAVVLLLAFSWAELLWAQADRGPTLAVLVVAYIALQLVLMAVFGTEAWLARGELFTVVARTFARMAPFELYVDEAAGACRSWRCDERDAQRIGCPTCWLDAERRSRGVRLRPYGAGVRREPGLGAGGGAFVVALLATVVYDGFRGTREYGSFQSAVAPNAGAHPLAAGTLTMLVVVVTFAAAFLAISAVVSLFEDGGVTDVARRYAPTLIPIAAVYFIAHYFLYWLYVGQLTPGAVLDPFEREWVPDYAAWAKIPSAAVWYVQAGLIVWGHVLAVVAAHRVSTRLHRRARSALTAQLPLVALMVLYTFAGLWVLGQALQGEGV